MYLQVVIILATLTQRLLGSSRPFNFVIKVFGDTVLIRDGISQVSLKHIGSNKDL